VAGLLFGFRKRWIETCITSCLVVPAISSAVFAMRIDAPSLFDTALWAMMTFACAFLAAFIAWASCAGSRHLAHVLHLKLTRRIKAP
jgi:hypothetical protein